MKVVLMTGKLSLISELYPKHHLGVQLLSFRAGRNIQLGVGLFIKKAMSRNLHLFYRNIVRRKHCIVLYGTNIVYYCTA